MMTTPPQTELLRLLINEARSGGEPVEERWRNVAPFAAQRGAEGTLLLVRDWTHDVVLLPGGDVLVLDTEDGQAPRTATEEEARTALFRAIRHYPELLSLLPSRPSEAVTCDQCDGTGVLIASLQNPALRGLVCRCGGAGWVVAERGRG